MKPATVTFHIGQAVRWPHAIDRIAQVDELRRSTVRIIYKTRKGRLRRPIVDAFTLDLLQEPCKPLLFDNPLCRGIVRPRSKTFEI